METLDTLIQDRHVQMIKAAIPFLSNSNQKDMAMIVRLMELQRTMALFQNPANNLHMCSEEDSDEEKPVQMLTAIREYCNDYEKETVDNLINFVQMFSTYETLFT